MAKHGKENIKKLLEKGFTIKESRDHHTPMVAENGAVIKVGNKESTIYPTVKYQQPFGKAAEIDYLTKKCESIEQEKLELLNHIDKLTDLGIQKDSRINELEEKTKRMSKILQDYDSLLAIGDSENSSLIAGIKYVTDLDSKSFKAKCHEFNMLYSEIKALPDSTEKKIRLDQFNKDRKIFLKARRCVIEHRKNKALVKGEYK